MSLAAGFADRPVEAARAFRVAMRAMARPGTIHEIDGPSVPGLPPAAAVLLLVLADHATPVYLAGRAAAARDWLTFHTGAPAGSKGAAFFAAGSWADLAPLDDYAIGTPEHPDRSATLIVETARLDADGPRLTGPGIETAARLSVPDAERLRRNADLYPQGVDFFLTCGPRLAALPRSTRIGDA
ncbi:MAG: phosphonate C-P lyase system protein PhnH [Paracoccaceae bacterium]